MPTLALALSMLALEQAVTVRREQAAADSDHARRPAAGRAAQAIAELPITQQTVRPPRPLPTRG